jgi:flagellar biosynthetic protein FliP
MNRRFVNSICVLAVVLIGVAAFAIAGPVAAQSPEPSELAEINPIRLLESASDLIRGNAAGNDSRSTADSESLSNESQAQPGEARQSSGLSTELNILLLLTVLSLAPSILILCTCFTRVVIVLGLLRQALGTQGLPPSQVIVGLSLFISLVVMAPTAERMYREGLEPYMSGRQTDYTVAWDRTKQPLRDFMFAQIEASGNWSAVYMMLNYRGVDTSDPAELTRADVDMLSLVPAFILSELKTAFLMGFRIYLPFLVIDMVISSMLISMGMLMLPPVLISLPFKLLLFVLVDGWQLVTGSLLTSVVQPDPMVAANFINAFGAIGFLASG